MDLFKQRFEVFFALSGVPGLVFDAGELLGNPIDYLTDVVVPALDLVSCRLSCLGGLLEVIVMKGCVGPSDVQGVLTFALWSPAIMEAIDSSLASMHWRLSLISVMYA